MEPMADTAYAVIEQMEQTAHDCGGNAIEQHNMPSQNQPRLNLGWCHT